MPAGDVTESVTLYVPYSVRDWYTSLRFNARLAGSPPRNRTSSDPPYHPR